MKTRFAPSPTGYLHVGGLRTALYAYLWAKKNKGKFILRIEDTDQERFVEGALENLIRSLNWADLDYDEGPILENGEVLEIGDCGPYIQSKRTEIYRDHAQKLIENGNAYRCFCTKEELDEMRERQIANGEAPMYNRKCLNLPESEISKKLEEKIPFVIRQKIPFELIKFKDLIRGNVKFHGKTIDDQVLVKSDGFPTYHLANVVDDHFMEITHVSRGEEWLPSTPKHIALYQAFDWQIPEFAHLPLLLNQDKSKLSKRQGDVAVEDYVEKGYEKEAIINFIAFLGWHPGKGIKEEIYSLAELENIFDLENVQKSGAVFNLEKLDWFDWMWKKQKHNEKLAKIAKKIDSKVKIEETRRGQFTYKFSGSNSSTGKQEANFIFKRGKLLYEIYEDKIPEKYKKDLNLEENSQNLNEPRDVAKILKVLITLEEKILKKQPEATEQLETFYNYPDYSKELLTHEKMGVDLDLAFNSLRKSLEILENLEDWREEIIQEKLVEGIKEMGVKNGQLLWPLRVALTGSQFSPGVFEVAFALGKEESLKRIKQTLKK